MKYRDRIIDREIGVQLAAMGGLLLRGPKGCGKTESARHHASSEIIMDDSVAVTHAMATDPSILLRGAVPRLLDEWQNQPDLWNTVRHEIDRRRKKGQFILTGSANPPDDVDLHSGIGRFGIINLHTMTWAEAGRSTGQVRFDDVLAGIDVNSTLIEGGIEDLAEGLVIGGWPGNLGLSESAASTANNNYLELLCEVDIARVDGKSRDPQKVRQLLRSLARNISTEASYSTISKDVYGEFEDLAKNTVMDHISALSRLMLIEELPAWNTHIRSAARLRKTPKRHLADPSLACSALGLSAAKLMNDLEYLGLLFESQVIHDLRVYAEYRGGKLYHYRDSNGLEADAILELRDGRWAAFEIKLGFGLVDEGAQSLLRFADNIDTAKTGEPMALSVITGNGFAHRRDDGVVVVPLSHIAQT